VFNYDTPQTIHLTEQTKQTTNTSVYDVII